MADTIVVSYALSKPPSTGLVAAVLERCNDRFPDDHPYRDGLRLSDSSITESAIDVLDGGLESFQYESSDPDQLQAFDYRVGVNRTEWTDCPSLELLVNDAYFRTDSDGTDEADAQRASSALRELVEGLYELLDGHEQGVRYACAIDNSDAVEYREQQPLVSDTDLKAAELPPIVWYQILPPKLVDAVGRQKLRDAPVWSVHELDDGSLSLAVDELPKLPHAGLETNRDAVTEFFE